MNQGRLNTAPLISLTTFFMSPPDAGDPDRNAARLGNGVI
jgi:hypothetical protein